MLEEIEAFIWKLSPQERDIIRKQLSQWHISEEELKIIQSSEHDIMAFLKSCRKLSDIERVVVLNVIWDVTTTTKSAINDIFGIPNNTTDTSISNKILMWPRTKYLSQWDDPESDWIEPN